MPERPRSLSRGIFAVAALLPCLAALAGCEAKPRAATLIYQPDLPRDTTPQRQAEAQANAARVLRGRLYVPGEVEPRADGQVAVHVYQPFDREQLPLLRQTLEEYVPLRFLVAAARWEHRQTIEAARASDGNELYEDGHLLAQWVPLASGVTLDDLGGEQQVIHREVADTQGGPPVRQVLLIIPEHYLAGEHVELAQAADDRSDGSAISIRLTEEGARQMERLTRRYQPNGDHVYQLAVVYNGRLYTAPRIQAVLGQSLVLTGKFSEQEIKQLLTRFGTGGLPCPLKLVSETFYP